DHLGRLGDMMERRGGNHSIELIRQGGTLELGALVMRTRGRLRVDADRFIPVRAQTWHETAFRTAAQVDDPRRRRRQPTAYERPCSRDPSLSGSDLVILGRAFSTNTSCRRWRASTHLRL